MAEENWTAVDALFEDLLIPSDPALDAALRASADAGLPPIQVAPNQGKLLNLLARAIGARNILEVGTLGGYSTIWLARAVPEGGRVTTLEIDPAHAEVAQASIDRAGVSDRVTIRVGRALETLPELEAQRRGPFDLTFIDADKQSTADYFTWAVRLSRRGSLIIVDNVVRRGEILDTSSSDPMVQGMLRFNTALAAEPRVDAAVLQTVGVKGHDGWAVALVTAEI